MYETEELEGVYVLEFERGSYSDYKLKTFYVFANSESEAVETFKGYLDSLKDEYRRMDFNKQYESPFYEFEQGFKSSDFGNYNPTEEKFTYFDAMELFNVRKLPVLKSK